MFLIVFYFNTSNASKIQIYIQITAVDLVVSEDKFLLSHFD
jgi:hypothetical protein